MSHSPRSRGPTARIARGLDWLAGALARRFAVDLRALAALRISLALLLLADLVLRSRSLVAFYTDRGVLPVVGYEAYYGSDFTIHALSGEPWYQALLFAVAGAFAVALLVGYRTRTVTFVSWVLLLSLHGRNPLVLNSGDTLIRMMLLWGIFVPLGARWSIDARRRDAERGSVATIGTMALLGQVVVVYLVNAVHKLNSDQWTSGEAVVTIMQLDHFSILLGPVIADYPPLLRVVTFAWLAMVTLSPLLLVLTGLRRAAFATLFAGMHLGMFATMKIGLFPLVSVAVLLPFYPPVVWDVLERRADSSARVRRLGDALDRLAAVLPNPTLSARAAGGVRSRFGYAVPDARPIFSMLLPWLLLTLVLTSNASSVDVADPPERLDETLELIEADQSWRMFAPNPLSTTRWYVAPGNLSDGTRVDALHGGEVDWDRPPNAADTFDSARWRKYMGNVRSLTHTAMPSYFGNHLCERWNREHDTELEDVRLFVLEEPASPYGEPTEVSRRELLEYDCSGDLVQS